jgi:hypothetical protein
VVFRGIAPLQEWAWASRNMPERPGSTSQRTVLTRPLQRRPTTSQYVARLSSCPTKSSLITPKHPPVSDSNETRLSECVVGQRELSTVSPEIASGHRLNVFRRFLLGKTTGTTPSRLSFVSYNLPCPRAPHSRHLEHDGTSLQRSCITRCRGTDEDKCMLPAQEARCNEIVPKKLSPRRYGTNGSLVRPSLIRNYRQRSRNCDESLARTARTLEKTPIVLHFFIIVHSTVAREHHRHVYFGTENRLALCGGGSWSSEMTVGCPGSSAVMASGTKMGRTLRGE